VCIKLNLDKLLSHDSQALQSGTFEGELATRLKFIDLLKERLVEEKNQHHYSILSIKIVNFKKIGNIVGKSEQEDFIHQFLTKVKELLNEYLIFAEYYHDLFVVLYKDVDFVELEKKAQSLYDKLEEFFASFNFKIEVALHVKKKRFVTKKSNI